MGTIFRNLDGTETRIDLRPSKYPMKSQSECKSDAQFRFGLRLRGIFPHSRILEEFGLPNTGALALDFWLPDEGFAFEVQGAQHFQFVKYYHGTLAGFRRQKMNDARKQRWCTLNNIKLICVKDTDVDSVDIVGLLNAG